MSKAAQMSNVLFLGLPSHGHVHPTLGLVNELTKQGEQVVYFASPEFKDKIESAGASFVGYRDDLNIFKPGGGAMAGVINKAPEIMANLLEQIRDRHFDYLIHSAAFPFAGPLTQLLGIPAISSLAVFAGLREFSIARMGGGHRYQEIARELEQTYGIQMPEDMMGLLMNKAGLNLVYTSRYFVPDPDFFDDSYAFVGPPVYERKEDMDFPWERLDGSNVLYISLGTVFGNHTPALYTHFFDAFAAWDGVVVMAAHQADLSARPVPGNFIVRDYVPQNALLKRTSVAITHGGMNSMSDLISNHVPFVCIPLGADQPLLAARAAELGAAISLDARTIDSDKLRAAVAEVTGNPNYLAGIKRINDSFREAGGYPEAVRRIRAFLSNTRDSA